MKSIIGVSLFVIRCLSSKHCAIVLLLTLFCPSFMMAQIIPVPKVEKIPFLPVTTTGIGNTLIRGNDFNDKSQTWMQLYTSDMAVSAEGYVYLTTTWEEGLRAAGIYKDGDALPEITGLGVNSGDAVAVNSKWAAYVRKLNTKDGPRTDLSLYPRNPGLAVDPLKKRSIQLPQQILPITGLAFDDKRERIYLADDAGVKVVSLKNFKLTNFNIPLIRAGKLEVDSAGNLWAIQRATSAYAYQELHGEIFGSEALDVEHALEKAISPSDKDSFIAKDKLKGFVGFDFGKLQAVSRFCIMGDMAKEDFRALKVQTSTIGRDGPWIDVETPQDKLYSWPEEYVTIDAMKPVRCVRVFGPGITMHRMRAFAPPLMVPGRVLKYDPDGNKLPQSIDDIANPMDISFDARYQRLWVADGGTDHQVHSYTGLDGVIKRGSSVGVKGGWRSQKGRISANCFENIRGIGTDSEGNLYVCDIGMAGMCQSRLQSFNQTGEPRWNLSGTSFLDAVDADPDSKVDLFSSFNHYRNEQWIASTLDRRRFPDDARTNGNALVYGVRRWQGKKFLITTTQHGSPMCVFRFQDGDEAAIPCAVISPRNTAKIWPPHQPLGFGSFIWTDGDGDGQFAPSEYSKALREDSDTAFQNIDDDGNYWFISRIKGKRYLRKIALTGLNPHGCPVWKWDAPENALFELPAPLQDPKARFGGFEIDSARNEVFLFGFPADKPNECGMNWPLGRFMQRCRIDNGKLTPTHNADLLHNVIIDKRNKDQAYGAALCGDYLFVAYAHHFTVLVYRRDDLTLVGRLDLGPQVLKPLMDGMHELIVGKDGDGFVLYTPHYVANAIHVRRWNGKTSGWIATPMPTLEGNTLKWNAVSGAVSWQLERRTLQLDGWGNWGLAGKLDGQIQTWVEKELFKAAAYRLRAIGNDGAKSDWSATIYQR